MRMSASGRASSGASGAAGRAPWAADPRLVLMLAALAGSLLWRMHWAGLSVLLVFLLTPLLLPPLRGRLTPGAWSGSLRFALFWSLASLLPKLLGLAPETASSPPSSLPGFLSVLPPGALAEAGLLFLRLTALLALSALLGLLTSPRSLGLAAAWFLRPLARDRAWRIGLSLSLMLRFLEQWRRIRHEQTLAFQARGLPRSGPRHWRHALPQLLRLLSADAGQRAEAVVSRHLNHAAAWEWTAPFPARQTLLAGCLGLGIMACSLWEQYP